MLILALDTTTRGGSVAIARDDLVLSVVHGDHSRTHGERLPGEIDSALSQAAVAGRDLDLLAVACGPGAFTGLRIGLATMQGLAMVLSKPVVGVSALAALADAAWRHTSSTTRAVAWMDAQRGEVFSAAFVRTPASTPTIVSQTEPIVAAPQAALAALPFSRDEDTLFVGDGALRYHDLIATDWGRRAQFVGPVPVLAPAIARLARRLADSGAAGPPHALQPLYVRRPDAELDRDRQAAP